MVLMLAAMPKQALLATTSTPRLSSCAFIASSSLAQAQRLHGPAIRSPHETLCHDKPAMRASFSLFLYPTFRSLLPAAHVGTKRAHSGPSLWMDAGGEQNLASRFFASLSPNRIAGKHLCAICSSSKVNLLTSLVSCAQAVS